MWNCAKCGVQTGTCNYGTPACPLCRQCWELADYPDPTENDNRRRLQQAADDDIRRQQGEEV